MVASKGNTVARMPALGLRTLILVVLSIVLMYVESPEHARLRAHHPGLDENHLDTVHDAIGTAMYPLRVVVDAPARLWSWMRERTRSREELQRENDDLREENRQLKMERDILKKATAFFAKENS